MHRKDTIMDRVLARVRYVPPPAPLTDECWEWTGPDSGKGRGGGYPRMSLDGATVPVHRVVYTHFFGYIPPRKQIDHRCCNRRCVNPAHLEMVTHRVNQKRRDDRRVTPKWVEIEGIEDFA